LPRDLPLEVHVRQSRNLAGLVAACFANDTEGVRAHLADEIVEPVRARLIPGFDRVKRAGLDAGALGVSISGSGPSLFAWADSAGRAAGVAAAMSRAFADAGLPSDTWICDISGDGAPGSRCVT
jgi:homoserine kinase